MSTYENAANLAPTFLRRVLARYEGTRLAAQEIAGLFLEDTVGALWTSLLIEAHRIDMTDGAGQYAAHLLRSAHDARVVGVDPPGSPLGVCGIVVAGRWAEDFHRASSVPWDPLKRHADVLEDASMSGQPEEWAKRVVDVYRSWECDAVVVERNFGGDMCRAAIHAVDSSVPVKEVRAADGKKVRATPVVGYYDQARVHHLGILADLETEQTTWVPPGTIDPETLEDIGAKWSPNRLDAAVWAVTFLLPPLAVQAAQASTPKGGGAARRAPVGARARGGMAQRRR